MAIIRGPRPTSNFHILDKRISEDNRLSWAARGLLIFLLGKPDRWQVSVANLVNEVVESRTKTGRDGTYGIINELIEAGYIVRAMARSEDGRLGGYDYVVRDNPFPSEPYTVEPFTAKTTQVSIEKAVKTDTCAADEKLKKTAIEAMFDQFWKAYPKRVAKLDAQKAFKQINPRQQELDVILQALERVKKSNDWTKDNGQYIPLPATWLRGRRWEDEGVVKAAPGRDPRFAGAK